MVSTLFSGKLFQLMDINSRVIPFRIGLAEAETDDVQVEEMGYVPQIDMIMERGILYTSFSLFIGVLFFNLIMYKGNATSVRSRSKNIIWISLFGILISLLFNLPLQAKINADVSWLEAFNPLLLKETLQLSVLVMYGLLKWFSLVRL